MSAFPHYFKALPPGCTHIDVYRVLSLFEVTDPALQHAVKKLLCAGARGAKDQAQDIAEAIATLQRWQQMRAEEEKPAPAPDDADRAAYLARWANAPEWAVELVQFSDGSCRWRSSKSELGLRASSPTGHNLLGSVRCEPRPVQGVGP